MRSLVGFVGAFAILSASALAQTAPTAEQLAQATLWENPIWTRRASARDFEAVHAQQSNGETARVALDCLVQSDAAIACVIAENQHATAHVADAALALSAKFRVALADADGASTIGRRVVLRLIFN